MMTTLLTNLLLHTVLVLVVLVLEKNGVFGHAQRCSWRPAVR